MSYRNPLHEARLVLLPVLPNAFSSICVSEAPDAKKIMLEGSDSAIVYQVDEVGGNNYPDLYNFPFLLHPNGCPWKEANDYLLSLMRDKAPINRRTDDVRRRASKLLDYLSFCEDNNLDWLDFSGARPPLRPTYKYFYHLINKGTRSNQVINQYTGVIYHFYKYVSEHWHDLDMKRVDTVKQVRFIVQGSKGAKVVEAEKRSQTRRTPPVSPVQLGFVREDGEALRPLYNLELGAFLSAIRNEKEWSAVERLILMTSLMTGARKQTVLTVRLRNLKGFTEDKLEREGAYKLHAGPSTGIDTKYDKPQVLYVPKQLADELVTLAKSPMMKRRREKFLAQLETSHPGLTVAEDDMYLFLSDQGNCYYMAKNDPRYTIVKSPQTGQVTETIKRKLITRVSSPFPKDFSYHWLRATFAYQLYQRLKPLVREGMLKSGEDIDFIQKRMHHESRETTENYLKLFNMTHEKIIAQEVWEGKLFNGGYALLKVEAHDE
ncbi:site-specific integrase [Pseudomonas syringae]|uniref:site-specific integrase n=1 Tax=Pseudomonas syringae TaxID=317 RepID=UPI0002092056|nr:MULTISPECIES: site-specific integrase [Pseudomonas syringae group]EGH94852.1 phage integrase family site specific recombinase [Pseudomonas amygdali pv. lachrymans str. M302278]KPC09974.1 Phage integrase family site specific recombinase [Pseudomonas amygdali pv. lachrymans]RMM16787.1 Phage integrase family site specific recombinase [Pseudomonas syringae]